MVIAAIYGAQGGKGKTNFGRNIVLQNLLHINIGAGAFVTGSGANLLAAALIGGAIGGSVFFSDWMMAMFPMVVGLMFIGYLLALKVFFPLAPGERVPQIEGGMDRLRLELRRMGKLDPQEVKALVIFILILGSGPRTGCTGSARPPLRSSGPSSPSAGRRHREVERRRRPLAPDALLGRGLHARIRAVHHRPALDQRQRLLRPPGIGQQTPFWALYLVLTGVMVFSALIFQSKTMRAMIFVPIAIGVASRFGYPVISLALPVAFMIEHVYVLPFNSKPAALLYETEMYS